MSAVFQYSAVSGRIPLGEAEPAVAPSRGAANPNGRVAFWPSFGDTRAVNRRRPILSFLARGPRPHAFRLSGLVFAAQAAPSNVFILSSFHVIIFFLQLIPPVTFLASLSKSNAKCRMMARFSAAYPVLTRE